MDWLFVDENPPTAPGWYGVSRIWCAREGIFPGADYWDGAAWRVGTRALLARSPEPFETEAAAEDWAYEHDMEGCNAK